jgi:hypothetical protein
MAKLIFSLDGAFLGEYPLDKERITIGRRPANDIHIDNLAVSGEHATIMNIGNDSFLEDVGSTNGTLVNGTPIKKHVLQHGDAIEFGKYQLRYINEAAMNAAAVEAGQVAPAKESIVGRIQVLNGPSKGKELVLNKALTTLGKPGVQVAVITKRPHGYFITHVEGQTHPLVNGASAGAQAHSLNDHDVIELAGVKMEFYLGKA